MKFSKLKYNIIFSLLITFIFCFLEFVFRFQFDSLINILKFTDYLGILLVLFLLSFVSIRFLGISMFLISVMFVLEIAHFNYYGYFIFPSEYILFFTKPADIYQTLITKLDVLIFPLLSAFVLVLFIPYVINKSKNRINTSKLNYFIIFLVFIAVTKTAINYEQKVLGEIPNDQKSIIKNILYTTKAFVGKTLPLYLFDISSVANAEVLKPFVINKNNQIDNIVFVIGESLSRKYMGLYGYQKSTTKMLEKRKQSDSNLTVLKAISSGVVTDTSIPMILNIAKKPNAMDHILSQNTNLFKLAKNNDFKTHFISAQSSHSFSYIRNYLGTRYIDKYIDSSDYGFDNLSSALDDILLEEIKKIKFNQKNFIVLNMRGSHSPYVNRAPESFKPFGVGSELQHYENSIAFTDKILNDIIEHINLDKKSKTLFIFTSDHGESVGPVSFGHGNIKNPEHYMVPLLFYTNNFKLNSEVEKITKELNLISHFNLALLCAYYLGYDTLGLIDNKNSYVNGHDLSGNAGYLEYDINTNKKDLK